MAKTKTKQKQKTARPKAKYQPTNGLLNRLKNEFAIIAGQWKELKRHTGEWLVEARSECSQTEFRLLQKWIKDRYQISVVQQRACMKLYEEPEIEEEVAERIPASTFVNISKVNMPKMDQVFTINSPDAGGPVKKSFRDFTSNDIRTCVTSHGVSDISKVEAPQQIKPFVTCLATGWRVDGRTLSLSVRSIKKEVRIRITPEMVNEILRATATTAA